MKMYWTTYSGRWGHGVHHLALSPFLDREEWMAFGIIVYPSPTHRGSYPSFWYLSLGFVKVVLNFPLNEINILICRFRWNCLRYFLNVYNLILVLSLFVSVRPSVYWYILSSLIRRALSISYSLHVAFFCHHQLQ